MSAETAGASLHRLLGDARRRLRRAAFAEGFLVLSSGGLLALLLGALAAFFRFSDLVVAGLELAVLAATLALVTVRYVRLLGRGLDRDESVARWLDRALDEKAKVHPSLLSAVEIARDRGRYGESETLGDAAVASTTEAIASVGAAEIVRDETKRSVNRRLRAALGVASVAIAVAFFAPEYLETALLSITSMDRIDEALERVPPDPRLGDIRVTYRFPAYTERTPVTVASPTGQIKALPGTEVVIETSARHEIARGSLLIFQGDDAQAEPTKIGIEADGRRLSATFVISRSGRYRFELTTLDGELLRERHGHEIELEIDDAPEVTMLEPQESPLEVNENDRVALFFTAKDDFALGDVSVAWRVMASAREGRVRLTSAANGLDRYTGGAQLELSQLDLKPGDRIAYSIEARDNDTVNGPKVGASETKELRIYSKKAHHEQVLALQEQALDELVHILGDNLERAFDTKAEITLHQKMLEAVGAIADRAINADELLRKTVAAIKKDPLGRPQVADAFEQARVTLRKDARRMRTAQEGASRSLERAKKPIDLRSKSVAQSQEKMVGALEKNVVYLADLLNDQRMIDAAALAKELREQQQALKQALEEYKNAPTEEKRKLLSQAIKEIRQRIEEIMKEMAKLSGEIPQDFVNSDALQMKSSQKQMDEVQRMLEEGDLEGAMEALERMLAQTEQMMSQLQEGRQELGSREYSEIAEQAQKLWDELEAVERDQRDLSLKTEKVSKDILDRMKDRLGDPKSFVEKQVRRIEQAQAALERVRPDRSMPDSEEFEMAEARLEDGKRALEARDFGAAKEVLERAEQQMNHLEQEARRRVDHSRRFGDFFGVGKSAEKLEHELRRSRPIVEQVLEDIEKLMPPPDTLLSEPERQKLSQYQRNQQELEQRAQQVGDDLERLGQQLPIVGPEMKGIVDEARQAMGEADRSLGGGDAPAALNQERRALDALRRLKQELEKMGEQGQGSQPGGVPLPFGQQASGSDSGENGNDPRSFEKVEIPQPDQYKAPAEFREDILEAAKQGTVEQYRDAVRRYYEELVK
jgi:hypothetical protein